MDLRDRLLVLIQSLYAAPGSTEGWRTFLLDLCVSLDGTAASFISHNLQAQRANISATARCDRTAVEAYNAHWGSSDPWLHSPNAKSLTAGVVSTGEALVSRADLRRTAYYNDFARHFDIGQALAGMIETGPDAWSFVSVNGANSRSGFAENDVTLLRALMPHLQRALQLHRRMATAEVTAQGSLAAFDRLAHGVLIVDHAGRLSQANRVGEELLRERDGLVMDQHELRAATTADTVALRRLLANAMGMGDGLVIGTAGGVLALPRPSGRRPLRIVVAPIVSDRTFLGPEPARAIVFVTDPERFQQIDEAQIQMIFGLTPAEARLARALAEGLDLQQAAGRLGLTIGTVRTRLKTIFQKTGVRRQPDLVRLILTSAPAM